MLFRGCGGGGHIERIGRHGGDHLSSEVWCGDLVSQQIFIPSGDLTNCADPHNMASDYPHYNKKQQNQKQQDNAPADRTFRPATYPVQFTPIL
jgi:hypothetical protein